MGNTMHGSILILMATGLTTVVRSTSINVTWISQICPDPAVRQLCNPNDPRNKYCNADQYCYVFGKTNHYGFNRCDPCTQVCSESNSGAPGYEEDRKRCEQDCALYLHRKCVSEAKEKYDVISKEDTDILSSLNEKLEECSADKIFYWNIIIGLLVVIVVFFILLAVGLFFILKKRSTIPAAQSNDPDEPVDAADPTTTVTAQTFQNQMYSASSNGGSGLHTGNHGNGSLPSSNPSAVIGAPPPYEEHRPLLDSNHGEGPRTTPSPVNPLPEGAAARKYQSAPQYSPSPTENTTPKSADGTLPTIETSSGGSQQNSSFRPLNGPEYYGQPQSAMPQSEPLNLISDGPSMQGIDPARHNENDFVPEHDPVMAEEHDDIDYRQQLLRQQSSCPETASTGQQH